MSKWVKCDESLNKIFFTKVNNRKKKNNGFM